MATAEPGGSTTTSATNGIDSSKNLVEVMTKSETETALAGKQDTLSTSQQAAVDSGITKDKVTAYSMTTQNLTRLSNRVDTIEDGVEGKQDSITVSPSAPTSSDGADGDIWLTYGADSGTLPENVLTRAQLDAANSGITASKVSTYDGYASGKQDKLTAGANITISEDNVISATGGGSSGVSSVNGKTGTVTIGASDVLTTAQLDACNSGITESQVDSLRDILRNPIVTDVVQFMPRDDDVMLVYKQTDIMGMESTLTRELTAVNSNFAGVVTPTQKSTWDGKQDKLTAGTNIQISGNTISATDTKYALPTASASVLGGVKVGSGLSISNGVLSATGGGGGGASLPENGYYWEKITEDNWPTDWNLTDVILTIIPYVQEARSSSGWNSNVSFEDMNSSTRTPVMLSFFAPEIIHSCVPYFISYNYDCISFNALIMNDDLEGRGIDYLWNHATDSTELITCTAIAHTGTDIQVQDIVVVTLSELTTNGLYRLRKFSS